VVAEPLPEPTEAQKEAALADIAKAYPDLEKWMG
jgi:hypothetical protein